LDFPVDYKIKPIVLGPIAYISFKNVGTKKCIRGKEEIEFIAISFECVTFNDLENEVNRLIKELEIIKKQGRKFFEKEIGKRRDYVKDKSQLD
jgi:hypothetical protein